MNEIVLAHAVTDTNWFEYQESGLWNLVFNNKCDSHNVAIKKSHEKRENIVATITEFQSVVLHQLKIRMQEY